MPDETSQRRRVAVRPVAMLAVSTAVALSGMIMLGGAVAAQPSNEGGSVSFAASQGPSTKDAEAQAEAKDPKEPEPQVTLCHATASRSNPYEKITIDRSGVLGSEKGKKDGHDSHHDCGR